MGKTTPSLSTLSLRQKQLVSRIRCICCLLSSSVNAELRLTDLFHHREKLDGWCDTGEGPRKETWQYLGRIKNGYTWLAMIWSEAMVGIFRDHIRSSTSPHRTRTTCNSSNNYNTTHNTQSLLNAIYLWIPVLSTPNQIHASNLHNGLQDSSLGARAGKHSQRPRSHLRCHRRWHSVHRY